MLLSAAAFWWVLKKTTPDLDANLLTGAAIFGIGWGIAGYCQGPAVASLGLGNPEALWLVPLLLAGLAVQRWIDILGYPAGRTSQTH